MRRRVVIAGLFFAASGYAHPDYPSDIAGDLGLSQPPDCSICHDGVQSATTAVRPFVNVLRQLGLGSADDPNALKTALLADEACSIDSDGDGKPDIVELRRGTNPSDGPGPPKSACVAEGGPQISLEPATWYQTGCAVRPANERRTPLGPLAAGFAAFICLLATRRRR
jgi:hypothetical protein